MKKLVLSLIILSSCNVLAVTPREQARHGVKRYYAEIDAEPAPETNMFNVLMAFAGSATPAQLMQLLDTTGIDVNQVNQNGNSILMLAAARGNAPNVNALIQRGAHINLQNDDSYTALHFAVSKGHLPVIIRLLQQPDIDLNLITYKGNTPLMTALLLKKEPVATLLLKSRVGASRAYVNTANNEGEYPLLKAIEQNNLPLFDQLLEAGVRICARPGLEIPLHVAVAEGHQEIVKRLLAFWVNVNEANEMGETPLMIAALKGNLTILKVLLHANANVQLRDKSNQTALDHAKKSESKNKTAVIKLLREAGRLQ